MNYDTFLFVAAELLTSVVYQQYMPTEIQLSLIIIMKHLIFLKFNTKHIEFEVF